MLLLHTQKYCLYRKGYTEIVRSLLEHGAKATLKEVNKRGLTAFGEAVVEGHLDLARLLLKVPSFSQVASVHFSCPLVFI